MTGEDAAARGLARTRRRRPAPSRAMVLAAGLGTRMGALSETLAKPLIRVAGRTLIDHAIDRLEEAGVDTVVVNLHHLGDSIERHLSGRSSPAIRFSREFERLETGGGVRQALPLLGTEPFFVVNGDVLSLNGPQPALDRLATAWDDRRMDALLLVQQTVDAHGYQGAGDFFLDPLGGVRRRPENQVAPYLFTGIQILHPRLFRDMAAGRFSLNLLYDQAIAAARLYGIVHDGEWFHVGTPEGVAETDAFLRARYPGKPRR